MASAALFTIAVFAFFAGNYATNSFPSSHYYQDLGDSFLHGSLSLLQKPPEALATLDNPYYLDERKDIDSLFDASYYNGNYYLYFSALPVILFYIPVRLIFGVFPSSQTSAVFFASLALIFWAGILRTAMKSTLLPKWAWVLALGLALLLPNRLWDPAVYGVAVLCGVACSAAWGYFLCRFRENGSERDACLMSLAASFAMASRPHLGILVLVSLWVLRKNKAIWMSLIPIVVVSALLATYNYARFGSPFELGVTYQISVVPMPRLGLPTWQGLARYVSQLFHYLFWPPQTFTEFPFLRLRESQVGDLGTYPGAAESLIGCLVLVPFLIAGVAMALVKAPKTDGAFRAAREMMVAGALILLFLPSFWLVTSRYTMDFLGLVALGAAICLENGFPRLKELALGPNAARALLACALIYSVLLGLSFSFPNP